LSSVLQAPMVCKVKVVVGHFAVWSVFPAHPYCIALTRQSTQAGLQNKPVVFAGAAHFSNHTHTNTQYTHATGQISCCMGQGNLTKRIEGIPAGSVAAQMKFVSLTMLIEGVLVSVSALVTVGTAQLAGGGTQVPWMASNFEFQ